MTKEDRNFLSGLADKLATVERIRIKGVTIDESQYILVDDEHAKILSTVLQEIIKRDVELESLLTQIEVYSRPSTSVLN